MKVVRAAALLLLSTVSAAPAQTSDDTTPSAAAGPTVAPRPFPARQPAFQMTRQHIFNSTPDFNCIDGACNVAPPPMADAATPSLPGTARPPAARPPQGFNCIDGSCVPQNGPFPNLGTGPTVSLVTPPTSAPTAPPSAAPSLLDPSSPLAPVPPSPGSVAGGTAGSLPQYVNMTYYWPFGSHPTIADLMSSAPQYNVLDYISAIPSGNGNANMILNGGGEANLASEIKTWQASGRVALLMVGGAGGTPINLKTDADVTNFVSSISKIIDTYHFQGIDWDLEDSFTNSTSAAVVSATAKLKAKYGAGFIIAAVPRAYEVRGGGIWAQCMKAMGANLDLISLQEYDNAAYADANFAQIKTDYADLIKQGFAASKILLGTSTQTGTSIAGGAATAAVYAKAYAFLKTTYGIRGAMVWQSNSDHSEGWAYATQLGAVIKP